VQSLTAVRWMDDECERRRMSVSDASLAPSQPGPDANRYPRHDRVHPDDGHRCVALCCIQVCRLHLERVTSGAMTPVAAAALCAAGIRRLGPNHCQLDQSMQRRIGRCGSTDGRMENNESK